MQAQRPRYSQESKLYCAAQAIEAVTSIVVRMQAKLCSSKITAKTDMH